MPCIYSFIAQLAERRSVKPKCVGSSPTEGAIKKKERKIKMTKEMEIIAIENRLKRLRGSIKNIKSPGVVRKLERKLRNLKNPKI